MACRAKCIPGPKRSNARQLSSAAPSTRKRNSRRSFGLPGSANPYTRSSRSLSAASPYEIVSCASADAPETHETANDAYPFAVSVSEKERSVSARVRERVKRFASSAQLASAPPWLNRSTPGASAYGARAPDVARDRIVLSAHLNWCKETNSFSAFSPKSAAWNASTNARRRATAASVGVPRSVASFLASQSRGTDISAFSSTSLASST
mmetsp:Transcript_11710/g.49101  ORF Transcript_11710/g.49101 Transcript_11710/m.49101 type:complete len:209 (+) Transcript_11710:924-1550(+)